MKKTTLYNIAFLCLAFAGLGVFTAFDDAQTDEQKVEAAYTVLLTAFTMEKEEACKAAALAQATTDFAAMEAAAAMTVVPEAQPVKGGKPKSTPKSTGTTSATGGTETPVVKEEPKVDPKGSKMSGNNTSSTDAKGDKMGGDSKSGTTTTDKKGDKMKGK